MTIVNITDHGAVSGATDNTDAIQNSLNMATPGDRVVIPTGDFLVDPLRSVFPRSGTTVQIIGTLRAIPVEKWDSAVVCLKGVSGVNVTGPGIIIGERAGNRSGGPGRHGSCLDIRDSQDITVNGGLVLKEGQGDGLYVQDCKNVVVDHVSCLENARNGLSIIGVEKMSVTNSIFGFTHSESPMPQAGIDIEPDLPTQAILDLTITGNQFIKNKGAGCYVAFQPGANRARVSIINNTFDQHFKDGSGPCMGGINTVLGNLAYATCRWIPGYDWWFYKRDYTL